MQRGCVWLLKILWFYFSHFIILEPINILKKYVVDYYNIPDTSLLFELNEQNIGIGDILYFGGKNKTPDLKPDKRGVVEAWGGRKKDEPWFPPMLARAREWRSLGGQSSWSPDFPGLQIHQPFLGKHVPERESAFFPSRTIPSCFLAWKEVLMSS